MSLWTPSGEHPVERGGAPSAPADDRGGPPADDEAAMIADARAAIETMAPEERSVLIETLASLGVEEPGSLSDDDLARHLLALNSLAATQQRLLEEPVASHIASHVVGLHQLAALHLAQQPPSLVDAQLAIDAMAGLLAAVEDRLGEAAPQLRDALVSLQQQYVAVAG